MGFLGMASQTFSIFQIKKLNIKKLAASSSFTSIRLLILILVPFYCIALYVFILSYMYLYIFCSLTILFGYFKAIFQSKKEWSNIEWAHKRSILWYVQCYELKGSLHLCDFWVLVHLIPYALNMVLFTTVLFF